VSVVIDGSGVDRCGFRKTKRAALILSHNQRGTEEHRGSNLPLRSGRERADSRVEIHENDACC
jgi:hypothetical protein